MRRNFLIVVIILLSATYISCNRTMYPSDMYIVNNKTYFSQNEELLNSSQPVIHKGDILSISVYSNKGENILHPLGTASDQIINQNESSEFTVDDSGYVNLPKIGKVFLLGKTIKECELIISELYSENVVDPYVTVFVKNKRVFFLTGGTSQSGVTIKYENDNTTLVDIITTAGGIKEGKAYAIRLLRQTPDELKFYNIDLSDFSQAKYSYIRILPNDIVYVEPVHRPFRKFIQNVAPYLTLVSTGLIIYNLVKN